jgi:hypothetical protein
LETILRLVQLVQLMVVLAVAEADQVAQEVVLLEAVQVETVAHLAQVQTET